ncbi:MAG TPA: DUF2905 domain-containing protein [Patescibacteria group bacterium]|nr:DUF2905 domain-containing protein [Patescibacteria group bacterium]
MDPLRESGKLLIGIGLLLVVVGAVLYAGSKLPFRLGRLPGDILVHGKGSTFYFPIVTCLVLSLVLTLLSWLFSTFKR